MKWIPVTERLPDGFHDVLVYVRDHNKVLMGCYLGGGVWLVMTGLQSKAVTHWMPIPEAPQ